MIRVTTRQQIDKHLDESFFGAANFLVTQGGEEHIYFSIRFIPNAEYSFWVLKLQHFINKFQIVYSPGPNILKDERKDLETMEKCIAEISSWVNRVKEEVVAASPLAREVEKFREEMEARLNSINERMDGYFSEQEADEFRSKLEVALERLRQLAETNVDLRQTVEELSRTVEHLKGAVDQVNKGTWYRMAAGKLVSFAKSVFATKEARELALDVAKKVLLEGTK